MDYLYSILTFILNLTTFYITFVGADYFFERKKNKNTFLLFFGMIIGIVALRSFLSSDIFNKNLRNIITLFPFVIIFLYLIVGHTGKIVGKVLYTLLVISLTGVIENICMSIIMLVANLEIQEMKQSPTIGLVATAISIIIYTIILLAIRKLKLSKWKINTDILKLLGIIAGINGVMVIAVYVLYNNVTFITKDTLFVMMSLVLFCMTALNIVVFYTMSKVAQKNHETTLEFQYMQAQEEQNKNMETVTQNLRQLRHDMNNHIGMLYGLCDTKQYDLMHKYLQQMLESTSQANDIIVVQNNQALSVVLNNKRALAEKYSIPFTYGIKKSETSEKLKAMPLSELETCSLFGNILDNAIEACKEMPNMADAGIKLLINEQENGWQILCKNTYNQKPVFEGGELVSQKSDAKNHGIGTKAMKSIIKKYKGSLKYEVTDEEFGVKIFIAS